MMTTDAEHEVNAVDVESVAIGVASDANGANNAGPMPAQMRNMAAWIEENPLRKWLDTNGRYNQRMLATVLSLSTNTIYYWVNGVKKPRDENIVKLAEITRISDLKEQWDEWWDLRGALWESE